MQTSSTIFRQFFAATDGTETVLETSTIIDPSTADCDFGSIISSRRLGQKEYLLMQNLLSLSEKYGLEQISNASFGQTFIKQW